MFYQTLSGFMKEPAGRATVFTVAATLTAATACAAPQQQNREEQCRHYADAQFKALGSQLTSGTTLSSQYDAKSGFCTVEVKNGGSSNTFFSRTITNTFDSTPTALPVPVIEPVHIVWKPAPKTLVCEKVEPQKNGKLLCTPYKPSEEEAADPFFPFLGW